MNPICRLTLTDSSGQEHSIPFEVRRTQIARRWAESVVYANRLSQIRESNRVHGFSDLGKPQVFPNVVVTWEDPIYQELEPEDLVHFTVKKEFGTCYIDYCQIGRHLYQMFLEDETIQEETEILPLKRISADTYIWFGSTTGQKTLEERNLKIRSWFERNEAQLNAKGYFQGQPELAMGWIPVATIAGDFSKIEAQTSFLKSLNGVNRVVALNIDP